MAKLNRQASGVVSGSSDVSHQTRVEPQAARTAKAGTALSRRKQAAKRGKKAAGRTATSAKSAVKATSRTVTKGKKAPAKKAPGKRGPPMKA